MKRLLALLIACTAMTFVFASCGDEKENSSANDTSVAETEAVTESTTESSDVTEVSDTDNSNNGQIKVDEQLETNAYIEDADKTPFIGKWECTRLVAGGEDIEELQGLPLYAVFQYDIHEDGTVSLPDSLIEASGPENVLVYTWGMLSEDEIEIVGISDSLRSSIKLTLKDGQLINIDNQRDEEIYLDKVDEFQYFDFQAYYDAALAQQPEYVLTPVETDADGNIIEDTETITAE